MKFSNFLNSVSKPVAVETRNWPPKKQNMHIFGNIELFGHYTHQPVIFLSETLPFCFRLAHGLHLPGLLIPFKILPMDWRLTAFEICHYSLNIFMQFQNQNKCCLHRCCAKTNCEFFGKRNIFWEKKHVWAQYIKNWEKLHYFVSHFILKKKECVYRLGYKQPR
jgi:hypothetical protein